MMQFPSGEAVLYRAAMTGDSHLPEEVASRFRSDVVLKRDVFSTIERGHFVTDRGEVPAVLRRIDVAPWWSFPLAHHLFRREKRALAIAGRLGIAPPLLFAGRRSLVRGWIDGLPLHIAKPMDDAAFFRSAKRALRALHRAGVAHNDLAKEQNWLRTPDGRAALTDFQLATRFRRRNALFRLLAYEDLRHLLKHKRRYAATALTPRELRVLANKSWPTRVWMATGKRVYYWITRGLLNFTDREGGGPRLVNDAPLLAGWLKRGPGVREVAIVAFPDRRTGVGLYAFVETDVGEADLLRGLSETPAPAKQPERLQVVSKLPRDRDGAVRTDILQLVAMNQLDLIDRLIASEAEKNVVAGIVAGRRNLRDRFAF
jgi:acyl-CoA synthetase (AMP-forming)/AMP-acid ligase II